MLKENIKSGYPFEFLIARLRNRINSLITTIAYLKGNLESQSDFDWNGYNLTFQREYVKLYFSIEEKERVLLRNLFIIFEIRNLISLIRYAFYERKEEIKEIFKKSLLSDEIRVIFLRDDSFKKKLENLSYHLGQINKELPNILNTFDEESFRSFEENFTKAILEGLVRDKKNIPEVRDFIKRFIDFINLNGLSKANYWNSEKAHLFIEGGFYTKKQLEEMSSQEDFTSSLRYMRKIVNELRKKIAHSDYYLFVFYISNLYLENINLNILFNRLNSIEREMETYIV